MFKYRLLIFFLFVFAVCNAQQRSLFKIKMDQDYKGINFDENQLDSLFQYNEQLSKIDISSNEKREKLNKFVYEIFNEQQRMKVDSIKEGRWKRGIKRQYSMVKLNDAQINNLYEYELLLRKDSAVTKFYKGLLVLDSLNNLLSVKQKEMQHNDQLRKDSIAIDRVIIRDSQYFLKYKLEESINSLYDEKYLKKLKRVSNRVVSNFSISDRDLLAEAKAIYFARLKETYNLKLKYCYSSNGDVAKNTIKFYEYKSLNDQIRVSLCPYWCIVGNRIDRSVYEEGQKLINILNFLNDKYDIDSTNTYRKFLSIRDSKANEVKLLKSQNSKQQRVITIGSTTDYREIKDIAELLLRG